MKNRLVLMLLTPLWLALPALADGPLLAPPTALNAVAMAAQQQGMNNCAPRIHQVSNFLGFGGEAGAALYIPPQQPNMSLAPLSMEVPTGNGTAYVSATFAPNQANGCGASYDAVVYWPQACDQVATQFGNLKRAGVVKYRIQVLDGGPATKVFLMPAGSGCVSIKREVVL